MEPPSVSDPYADSILPPWDPRRLTRKIPFNLALCGGRRQGKSMALADLIERNAARFGLVADATFCLANEGRLLVHKK